MTPGQLSSERMLSRSKRGVTVANYTPRTAMNGFRRSSYAKKMTMNSDE